MTAHIKHRNSPQKNSVLSVLDTVISNPANLESTAPNIRYKPGMYSPKKTIISPKTCTRDFNIHHKIFITNNKPVTNEDSTFPIN